MAGDNALTDVLRTSVSCDNSVMVFHMDVLTINFGKSLIDFLGTI